MTTAAAAVVEKTEIIFLFAIGAYNEHDREEETSENDSLAGSTVTAVGSRLHDFP